MSENTANEILDKIKGKARVLKFHAERGNNENYMLAVKQMEICTSPAFPDFFFVVCENMIFKGNKLDDSSYSIYSFDKDGNYLEEHNIKELPAAFIGDRNTITLI